MKMKIQLDKLGESLPISTHLAVLTLALVSGWALKEYLEIMELLGQKIMECNSRFSKARIKLQT